MLVAGASTSWGVAAAVGPEIFSDHLAAAGVEQTAGETTHVEEAFASATVSAVTVALAVSLVIALLVTWFFTHQVKRSVERSRPRRPGSPTATTVCRSLLPGWAGSSTCSAPPSNELAGRLEKVEQTRRRMLAELAHERRPRWPPSTPTLRRSRTGQSADADTIALLRSSTERLGRLSRDISATSKAEEGRAADRSANLLDNAIRRSPAGREVVVSSRRIDRRWVEVSVVDAGDGIAAEHLGQSSTASTGPTPRANRQQGGSGIGLTITRALVEAHGGDIVATSPGRGAGARFTMRLPALK